MKRSRSDAPDYAYGHVMLSVRSALGLTQAGLAAQLGVSRNAIGTWEAGISYPKRAHLMALTMLALEHQVWPPGGEVEAIRALWRAARQKLLLDEAWLAALLRDPPLPRAWATLRSGAATDRSAALDDGWVDRTLARHVALPSATGPVPDYRTAQASDTPAPADPSLDTFSAPSIAVAGTVLPATIGLLSQPTSFIGRDAELTVLARMLRDPACRLLTLLGPGGIGKTRLALAVAAAHTATYRDGVACVALAAVGSAHQIVSAIGDALGVSFVGQRDPVAHLLGVLSACELLLVLDNFEHLVASGEIVADILAHAPRVTILVTSRERLNLQAEWLFDVDGLAYPPTDRHSPIQSEHEPDPTAYSAVQLFVQRAMQVQAGFQATPANVWTIARICEHIAGMPLAIELAAAGLRSVPLDALERQIRTNIDVLTTTLRDVPPRHRSLRAVFDHSWNLLCEQERTLCSRLAVFRGGWTLQAAEQVVGATLATLTALINKSLVCPGSGELGSSAVGAAPNAAAEPRFALLEPLREYALEHLAARGEAMALQHAHATYFLALAESAAAHWDTPAAEAAVAQLEREHDNVRAALRWACNGGDRTIGLQLGEALRRFWRSRGYISEGRVWLAELLALDDRSPDPSAQTARLRALHAAAWLAADQHDFASAARLLEHSLPLHHALGETDGEIQLLINAALEARAAGHYRQATSWLEDAVARHRALGDRGSMSGGGLGMSLYELALVRREQGDFAQAAALYHECVALHRDLGDREGVSCALLGLADVARDQGDVATLRRNSQESLAVFQELGVQWAIGFALNNLALAAYLEGDLPRARAVANESVALFRSLDAGASLGEVLITMGQIAGAQGDGTAAYTALAEALRFTQPAGPRVLLPAALEGLAGLLAEAERTELAVRLLGAASALRVQMGTPLRQADQAAVEHALAAARSTLDATTFAAVWVQAYEEPLDQILRTLPDAAIVDGLLATGPTRQSSSLRATQA